MSTWGGSSRAGRFASDLVFLMVLSLGFAVPLVHHLVASSSGTASSGSSGTSSSSGSSGSSGTSSSGDSGGSDPAPVDPGIPSVPAIPSVPTEDSSEPTSPPTSPPTSQAPAPDPDPQDEGSNGTSGSSGSDDPPPSDGDGDRPLEVGDEFATTVESLPPFLPLYCLIGLLDDEAAADLPEGAPQAAARYCGNVDLEGFGEGFGEGGGDGTSNATSNDTDVTITSETTLNVTVRPPGTGETRPRILVTPAPDDDNRFLGTLLVIALLVILVLAVALVLVLRRRRPEAPQ